MACDAFATFPSGSNGAAEAKACADVIARLAKGTTLRHAARLAIGRFGLGGPI